MKTTRMIGIGEGDHTTLPARPLAGYEPPNEFIAGLVERAKESGIARAKDAEGCEVTVQVWDEEDVSAAAAAMGRKGRAAKIEAQAQASRANGARGGRPALANRVQVIDRMDGNRVMSEHLTFALAERAAKRRGAGDRYGLRIKYEDMAEPPRE